MSTWRWPFTGRSTVRNSAEHLAALGALDQRLHEAAVAHHVKLEPERLLHRLGDVLDRADRHGGEACTGCRPRARRGRRGSRRRHAACRQSPVGASASGSASSSPSTVVVRLRCDTSTSTRWRSLMARMSSTLASRVCSE